LSGKVSARLFGVAKRTKMTASSYPNAAGNRGRSNRVRRNGNGGRGAGRHRQLAPKKRRDLSVHNAAETLPAPQPRDVTGECDTVPVTKKTLQRQFCVLTRH